MKTTNRNRYYSDSKKAAGKYTQHVEAVYREEGGQSPENMTGDWSRTTMCSLSHELSSVEISNPSIVISPD